MQRTLISQTPTLIGQSVKLQGWVNTKRDHGKLTFIDLRDKSGVVQCVGWQKMSELSTESVVEIIGEVKARPEKLINLEIATGSVEIEVQNYVVLNKAIELPILVEGDGREVKEEARLRYRYLDLRRERMQKILHLRSELGRYLRESLQAQEFVEVETPMLTKSTQEGARDFIVPSRFQPGKFYALPQSPQQYKQLLMTAGVDRYFQFARCIRDEDLRSDRGFEFTQLDLEMSFTTREEVMDSVEKMVKYAVTKVGGQLKQDPFPVIDYAEAIQKYGADKFDLRTAQEKESGVLAFAWVINFPFFKQVNKDDAAEVADGRSGWTFTHNPFSRPTDEFVAYHLAGKNVGSILTTQYDLVCNGFEVGGGSIRAHEPEILEATYKIMGYDQAQTVASVGHMLEAFRLGTPPHGGIALGLDRLVMLLAKEESLKEAIAFPMTSSGRTAVMDAPAPVSQQQLDDLSLNVKTTTGLAPHDFILNLLQKSGVSYQYLSHQPVFTSEEAVKVRAGGTLHQGAKALIVEADKEYLVVVVPGDMRADFDQIKAKLEMKKISMASRETVKAKTGLEVGSIPPFGSSMGMRTILDSRLADNQEIAFNCGRHDRSVMMRYEDYVKLEKPLIV